MSIEYLTFFIINKAGTLLYYRDFYEEKNQNFDRLSSNDQITLASTFHSLHAISQDIGIHHQKNQGIITLTCNSFILRVLQTLTGLKLVLVIAPAKVPSLKPSLLNKADQILKNIYVLYVNYVLKNPFYQMNMPVRCEQFNIQLNLLLKNKG